jgi:cell division protein ZapD
MGPREPISNLTEPPVQHDAITFEHPLNERIRNILRLEFLFQQTGRYARGESPWDSRAMVDGLMDILSVFGRADLKTELIKELERNLVTLQALSENPGVDAQRLGSILHRLEELRERLQRMDGQLGQELRDDEFLNTVRQRSTIPGGTCAFDLPAYHRWLQRPAEERTEMQSRWYASLDPVRQTVELILKLLRNSAEPSLENAPNGCYQRNLDASVPYQLIRVMLPPGSPYFVEVSGGKHRFSLRFLEPRDGERPVQAAEDVRFQLTCCVL